MNRRRIVGALVVLALAGAIWWYMSSQSAAQPAVGPLPAPTGDGTAPVIVPARTPATARRTSTTKGSTTTRTSAGTSSNPGRTDTGRFG